MPNDPQLLHNIINFSLHSLFLIFKIILGFSSIYLILQRFHLSFQIRFLKNITDEILKINDFCIEFSTKFSQFKYTYYFEDLKTYNEIISLRHKIHNHLDYLTSSINSFPYGNPINFFWYTLTGKYFNQTTQTKADKFLTLYQSKITDDTVLQKDIDLRICWIKHTDLYNSKTKYPLEIDANQIDEIILSGLDLIEILENHSKKLL